MSNIKIRAGQVYKTRNGDNMTLYRQRDFNSMARKLLKKDGKSYNEIRDIVSKILTRYGEHTYLWGIVHDASSFTFQGYDKNGNVIDSIGYINTESVINLIVE